jgi:DNA helicase-2/ATP-dependent DNA helicase PcrA
MDYFEGLNEPQQQAVRHKDGPLMIVAGAGSGKTRVLTTRIAHLIHQGVDPFHILALTFTNKAAREMKDRVEGILGSTEARNLYIGTFHSVFARILRIEGTHLGYPSNFTIYDTDDSRSLLKTIIHEQNLDDKHYKPSQVFHRISAAKNSLIGPQEYLNDSQVQQEDSRAGRPAMGKLYELYARRCFRNGAMDFDDLLYQMYILLNTVPAVLHKYQHKFRYILIDEFQDTNPAQYQVIRMLGAVHENVCVVGDDAQSIYSFRGATIQNILQFRKDYEDTLLVKLEQNYRSTKSILHAANEVITHNKTQIEKALWTENAEGEKIRLVRTMTDNEEGKFVADAITELRLRNHFACRDVAILYRTNAQSRSFEENLRRMNIAYRIYGGISFYQRREIKDFVGYLRVIVNPKDEESLRRIINYPVRGIGKTTMEKLTIVAHERDIPLFDVMSDASSAGIRGATLQTIGDFIIMIRSLQTQLQRQNAYEVAMQVSKSTGLIKELFNDKSVEGVAKYENIEELLNSIKEFTETPTEDGELLDKSLGSYLQQITLLTDADEDKDEQDTVKLMTIHAAKGLEFPCVFVGGLEEGLFPNAMASGTREGLEEERRLFYVAITRAKTKLCLSYANTRYHFGNLQQNDASRFLEEIPEKYLEKNFTSRQAGQLSSGRSGLPFHERFRNTIQPNRASQTATASDRTAVNDFIADDPSLMVPGVVVEHQKFGIGHIIRIEGAAANRIATIVFPSGGGEKKIMLGYARLRVVKADTSNQNQASSSESSI